MDRFSDLETFVLVSELSSVSKAASKLQKAPSAVSRRLKDLEARLETQLLIRTTRQITLTSSGERFLARARQILADLDEAESDASADVRTLHGVLRLTMPLGFGIAHLSPALDAFLIRHSSLVMELDLTDSQRDLTAEQLDLAIRIGELGDSRLQSRRLATIRSVIVAAPAFWEKHGKPTTPEDLEHLPALCYSNLKKPGQWDWQSPMGIRGSVLLQPRLLANNGEVLAQAAANALGVTREPLFITSEAISRGELEPALTDYSWGEVGLYAVYPQTRYLTRRSRALIDHLVEWFGDEPSWDRCLHGS